MKHIQPPKEKSILQIRKTVRHNFSINSSSLKLRRYWLRKWVISKDSKVLTSEMKYTVNPEDTTRLQNLSPLPSENYESPIQLRFDPPHHWPSEDEILEMWNTPEMEERDQKYHSMVTLFKYIRSRSLLCAPDIEGNGETKWRYQSHSSCWCLTKGILATCETKCGPF